MSLDDGLSLALRSILERDDSTLDATEAAVVDEDGVRNLSHDELEEHKPEIADEEDEETEE